MLEIVVCLKWVELRPEVDPLTGAVTTDPRFSGASPADRSALEWGLRLMEWFGGSLTAVSLGPPEAERSLREALAAGAERAVLLPGDGHEPSEAVALSLARLCEGADLVCCGVHSVDRGSGAVPGFLAHHLGVDQALGLVEIDRVPRPDRREGRSTDLVVAERRLDHGRRERLAIDGRCVLSFEAGPELRRAPLAAALAASSSSVEHVAVRPVEEVESPTVSAAGPYRPRTKIKPSPTGSTRARLGQLLGSEGGPSPAKQHELGPEEAADLVVDQLEAWGYLEQGDGDPGPTPR